MNLKMLFMVTLVVAAIGAINWGLISLLDYNLVTTLFGEGTVLTKVIYAAIGISGIWVIAASAFGMDKKR